MQHKVLHVQNVIIRSKTFLHHFVFVWDYGVSCQPINTRKDEDYRLLTQESRWDIFLGLFRFKRNYDIVCQHNQKVTDWNLAKKVEKGTQVVDESQSNVMISRSQVHRVAPYSDQAEKAHNAPRQNWAHKVNNPPMEFIVDQSPSLHLKEHHVKQVPHSDDKQNVAICVKPHDVEVHEHAMACVNEKEHPRSKVDCL